MRQTISPQMQLGEVDALEANGLDKCPDKGIESFKRYVALAVVASNLKRLGKILLTRDRQ